MLAESCINPAKISVDICGELVIFTTMKRFILQLNGTSWDTTVGNLSFCNDILSKFGLDPRFNYRMSVRLTPKNTHHKIVLQLTRIGNWTWYSDEVAYDQSYQRFFSNNRAINAAIRKILPLAEHVTVWVKFTKIP